jgi:NitT/TauT family transport system permease protein
VDTSYRKERNMKLGENIKTFIKGFIMVNILWYLAATILQMRVLPSPLDVFMGFGKLFEKQIMLHILASVWRVFAAIGLSFIIGMPFGILMAYSKFWDSVLNPMVYFTYPIPKTALLPMVMLLFGLGDKSKIIVITLIVIFQIIVGVKGAITNIQPEFYDPLKTLGASKYQVFKSVTLPAILPEAITNLRLSIGTSLSILFFIEGYGTRYGIGYFILDSWTRIDYISMYGGIIVVSVLGFVLFILVDLLEQKLCKWKMR